MVVCNDSASFSPVRPTVYLSGRVDQFTPILQPGESYSATLQPFPPPPPGTAIQMRWLAIKSKNPAAAQVSAHYHMGAVGNPP